MTKPRTRSVARMEAAAAAAAEEEAGNPDGVEGAAVAAVAPEAAAEGPSEPNAGEASREPDAGQASREPGAAGPSREPDVAGPSREPDAAGPSREPGAAGGSREPGAAGGSRQPVPDAAQLAVVPYVEDIDRKYEEIHPPHVRNFSAVTVNTYTTQQVSKMELDILRFLNFDVGSPTVITFLRKFLTSCCGGNNSSNRKLELMCNYLAELSLLDDYYIRFLPSIVAAACLFVGKFTLNPNTRPWFGSVSTITPPENIKVCFLKDLKYANS
ncbi:hypothetical protein OsI_10468 [Oryza sativa Indica Group]|uniref:Cyclin N-terminal domain-containing protein n=1 Tax=Oryza sativa subsp. indica TaxID=39946 RepID=B8AQG8_ORYSI|nr:hypothetical protein OsI_10468 [Oryza sativa Indica Group]